MAKNKKKDIQEEVAEEVVTEAAETAEETPEVPQVNEWEEKYNAERDAHLRVAA